MFSENNGPGTRQASYDIIAGIEKSIVNGIGFPQMVKNGSLNYDGAKGYIEKLLLLDLLEDPKGRKKIEGDAQEFYKGLKLTQKGHKYLDVYTEVNNLFDSKYKVKPEPSVKKELLIKMIVTNGNRKKNNDQNRTFYDICAKIISSAINGKFKDYLLRYYAGLSHVQFNRYIDHLISTGLLEKNGNIRTADKGFRYLQLYSEMTELVFIPEQTNNHFNLQTPKPLQRQSTLNEEQLSLNENPLDKTPNDPTKEFSNLLKD